MGLRRQRERRGNQEGKEEVGVVWGGGGVQRAHTHPGRREALDRGRRSFLLASAVGTAMHKTTSSTGGTAPGLIYSARVYS